MCQALYFRQFHVRNLEAVLIKIFRCLKCSSKGNFQLKRHLESNQSCFKFYKERKKDNSCKCIEQIEE